MFCFSKLAFLRRLCDAVVQKCGGRCACFSSNDGDGFKYALSYPGGDLKELGKALNATLNGRGGGKPDFIQGSVQATKEEIIRFLS